MEYKKWEQVGEESSNFFAVGLQVVENKMKIKYSIKPRQCKVN